MLVLYDKERIWMQSKLEKALEKCKKQCDKLGIQYGNVIAISPARKGTKRWGVCKGKWCGSGMVYSIEINQRLLADGIGDAGLLDTVMHELLHTCKECSNHGNVWKRYAEMVNREYGYNIKRTSTAEEKGVEVVSPQSKYKFKCTKCGVIIGRNRASTFTKNPEHYKCAACGGKFIRL